MPCFEPRAEDMYKEQSETIKKLQELSNKLARINCEIINKLDKLDGTLELSPEAFEWYQEHTRFDKERE